jgi:hypothetical protein
MRLKTQTLAIAAIMAVASFQLFSCQKDESAATAVSSSTVSDAVAKQNLVAWYKFNGGNTGDYSGYNNHLLPYSVISDAGISEKPNTAFTFTGKKNSYMKAANSSSLNPTQISIAVLFKPNGYYSGDGSSTRILMKGTDDQSNGVYFLGFHNDGTAYGNYGDNQYQSIGVHSDPNVIQLNQWYKMVYTYNGKKGKLYINDALVGVTEGTASFTPNNTPLRIGKTGRSDFPYDFNGTIDEIRIYKIALTAAQVSKVDAELGK